MGIRYNITSCPKCKKTLGVYSDADLIGNIKNRYNKYRVFGMCPYCKEIYKTGSKLTEDMNIEEKKEFLDNMKYENQFMKELEYSFYELECNINVESDKWWKNVFNYLLEANLRPVFECTKNKKIILKENNLLYIEELTKGQKEVIEKYKDELIDLIYSVSKINITDIICITNYTSIEEIKKIEREIKYRKAYEIFFRGGEIQLLGFIKAIKRIIYPKELLSSEFLNIYIQLGTFYLAKEITLQKMYNMIKEGIPSFTSENIKEILAIMLFNIKYNNTDVNIEEARRIIEKKFMKKVNKVIV